MRDLTEAALALNREALARIDDMDEWTALGAMLRENARRNPCALSRNNHAAYLLSEVAEPSGNRSRRLGDLYAVQAIHLLKKNAPGAGDYHACAMLGEAYMKLRRYKASAAHWERALRLRDSREAAYNLALCLMRDARYAEAAEAFETLWNGVPEPDPQKRHRRLLQELTISWEEPIYAQYCACLALCGKLRPDARAGQWMQGLCGDGFYFALLGDVPALRRSLARMARLGQCEARLQALLVAKERKLTGIDWRYQFGVCKKELGAARYLLARALYSVPRRLYDPWTFTNGIFRECHFIGCPKHHTA